MQGRRPDQQGKTHGPQQQQPLQATAGGEPQQRKQQAATERRGPQQKQQPPTTEGRGSAAETATASREHQPLARCQRSNNRSRADQALSRGVGPCRTSRTLPPT